MPVTCNKQKIQNEKLSVRGEPIFLIDYCLENENLGY